MTIKMWPDPEVYPRFDTTAKCPKCGAAAGNVGVEYTSGQSWPVGTRRITPPGERPRFLQYMLRICGVCGATWREECLDTPEEDLDLVRAYPRSD